MRLVPSGRRLVFPDGHVEEGFAVEFDERDQTIAVLRAERDRLREALEGRAATIALHKILNLAQHGTPPNYHRWISTLDNIAEIARRALGGK